MKLRGSQSQLWLRCMEFQSITFAGGNDLVTEELEREERSRI